MKPSISRDVHYRFSGQCIAAKVVAVRQDDVELYLFPPSHIALPHLARNVPEGDADGSWHWPERVEG